LDFPVCPVALLQVEEEEEEEEEEEFFNHCL
jgi:hypothetical protein